MIIDFVDITMPDAEECELAAIRARGREPVTISQSRTNSVGLAIDAIIERANSGGGFGVITLLRFFGHGDSGGMGITDSNNISNDMVPYSNVVSRTVVVANQHEFARLRPYFAANARVELHGCNVARGDRGQRLLKTLAAIWGVPVSAGSHTQWVGATSAFSRFEGTFYTAYPNGRLTRNANQRSHR